MRDCKKFVARLALAIHPGPQLLFFIPAGGKLFLRASRRMDDDPVKRRRALLGSNPLRNSRGKLTTMTGGAVVLRHAGPLLSCIFRHRGRFPHALKTHCAGTRPCAVEWVCASHEQMCALRSPGSFSEQAGRRQQFRGELASRARHRAANLYAVDPARIETMMQSCASGAKLRAAGPFWVAALSAKVTIGSPPPRIVVGE